MYLAALFFLITLTLVVAAFGSALLMSPDAAGADPDRRPL